jgi:hypothetical protein
MTTIEWVREHFTEARLRGALAGSGIPPHMHDGYVRYIRDGYRPGHFLCAVFSNDLTEAVDRADHDNAQALAQHVRFLYNCAPRACWGSPARLDAWLAMFREDRARAVGGN